MIDQVGPADLDAWIQSQAGAGAKALVLDVREPWELERASIGPHASYELLAIPMNEVPARLAELNPDRPLACLCHHGARSMRVASFLAGHGFEQLANIAGGIEAWSQQLDASVPRY